MTPCYVELARFAIQFRVLLHLRLDGEGRSHYSYATCNIERMVESKRGEERSDFESVKKH